MTDKKWIEGEYRFKAPDGCNYDSPKQYVWISVLGFCGCYSDTLFDLAFRILECLYKAHKENTTWYYEYNGKTQDQQDLQEILLHVMDDKDLTEHGSSVRGSWLTEKGIKLCELVFEGKNG